MLNNAAGKNAFGGGLFFTSDDMLGTLTITDSTITGNTGGYCTNVSSGNVTDAGTAIGVNANNIILTNSTLQKCRPPSDTRRRAWFASLTAAVRRRSPSLLLACSWPPGAASGDSPGRA